MNKVMKFLTGMVMGMAFAASAFGTTTAMAADKPAVMSKAVFQNGVYAEDEDEAVLLAIYEVNGKYIAYISDGEDDVYTDCKLYTTTVKGADEAQKITFEGGEFIWFRVGNDMYLTDNLGFVAGARYVEAWEPDAVHDAIVKAGKQ